MSLETDYSSVDQVRRHVVDLVQSHLSPAKLGDISDDKYQSVAKVLFELLKQFPHSFVPSKTSFDSKFLEWIFTSLLNILIQRQKDGVTDELTQWLIQILKLKSRLFIPLLGVTITVLQDSSLLLVTEDSFVPLTCVYYHNLNKNSKCSEENSKESGGEIIPDPPTISLPSRKEVVALLKISMEILEPFVSQISLFYSSRLASILSNISVVLLHPDKTLREKTFKLVNDLIEVRSAFRPSAIDRLYSSLIMYLKRLDECNGYNDEGSITCLYKMFGKLHNSKPMSPPSFLKPLAVVLVSLIYSGLYNKSSTALQECIGVLVHRCWMSQALTPTMFFNTLCKVFGTVNNLKQFVPVTSSILIHELWKLKMRIKQLTEKRKSSAQVGSSVPAKLAESKKITETVFLRLFDGRECHTKQNLLSGGELSITCFINLLARCSNELTKLHKLSVTVPTELHTEILNLIDGYCFLIEVYCVVWHNSKLQLYSIVGYNLMNSCLYNLQCLLHWASSHPQSSFQTKVFKVLLISAFQVSCSQLTETDPPLQSRLNLCLWIMTLPWKEIDSASVDSELSVEQRNSLKKSTTELFEEDHEVLLASLKGLSSVSIASWVQTKVTLLQIALTNPLLQCDLMSYLPILLVTMETVDPGVILKDCLGVSWTTEMMLGFTRRLLMFSLILAGEKKLIVVQSSKPLSPECCIDMTGLKKMDDKGPLCDRFCHLLSHVLNSTSDPSVLTEAINVTVKSLTIIGCKAVSLLVQLLHHPNELVINCLSNHCGILSSYLCDMANKDDVSTHPFVVKIKELVGSGQGRNCELAAKILGSVGKSSGSSLAHHCIVLLLELIYRGNPTVQAAAFVQLKVISKSRNISSKLPLSLKRSISELLVEVLNEKPTAITSGQAFIYEVAVIFDHESLDSFLHDIVDIFVPLLVADGSDNALDCIKFIAPKLNKTSQELLYNYFKQIFSHLVCYCSESRRKASLQLVQNTIQLELKAIIRSNPVNILTNLLLYLLPHRQQVVVGICLLAEIEDSVPVISDDDLAQYLYPKLLPILKFFDAMLVRSSHHGDTEAGKLAVSSLTELIKLMGPKYITPCRVNMMALLRSSQKFRDQEICRLTCSAWGWFVKSVDLASLGPLLSQIVVALTPLVNKFPDIISDILRYLIVEHKDDLSPFFNEVYVMPDEPILADVNEVLRQTPLAPLGGEEPILNQQLKHVLKGIRHERADVKLHATRALQQKLKENKSEVQQLIVGTDMVDYVVTDLVSSIVSNLRGSDSALRLKCGECLGLLGAIDPGRLKIPVFAPKKQKALFEVDELSPDFAVEFITELTSAFLAAADAQVQTCCAFAIQEALLIYNCVNADQNSAGARVWRKLPENIRELVEHYQRSTYSPRYPPIKPTTLPMFNPSSNLSFKDWVQKWTSHVIAELPESKPKRLFLPCTLIFKHNISPGLFLLPHALLCLLCLKKDSMSGVFKEITTVLERAKTSRGLLDTKVAMCTQAIFTALDYLQDWLHHQSPVQQTKGKAVKTPTANSKHKIVVKEFLSKISKELLAHAAYNCRAYARALKYLEQHLLSCNDRNEVQKNLGFLQEIFASLNDFDGVAGVAAIRRGEPSIREQILQFESTGNFHNAADCYRRAIQKDPKSPRNHEGLLQCMTNLGEFTSVLHHVNGIIAERREWTPLFNAYRVESAWKLGDWKSLEQTLKEGSCESRSWGISLGKVLISAKRKDSNLFQKNLLHVRNTLMGPLAAASLEQGSYQRGYEYITKLHMLEEVEEFVNEIIFGSGDISSKLGRILSSWKNRLKATQESFKTQESILNLHRILMGLLMDSKIPLQTDLNSVIGSLWLKSAKVARHGNCLQTAHNLLLQASDYSLPELILEKAEWIRCRDDSHQAMLSLQKAIEESWPNQPSEVDYPNQAINNTTSHAKAVLMIGKWMEDTEHESQTILKQYKAAVKLDPQSEETHFCLGKYYDRLLTLVQSKPHQYSEVLQFSIQHYGNALQYGNQFIYHCMPRALSLWLDYSSRLHDPTGSKQEPSSIKSQITKINKLMDSLVTKLPPYQFLVAFSQLISRVCHPDNEVFATLKGIILKLIEHYPQQSLWMMIAVSKSTLKPRQRRCKDILDKAKQIFPQLEQVIKDMTDLSAYLLEVCSYGSIGSKPVGSMITSMDKVCRELVRRTTHKDFSPIIVPLQSSLTVTLPTSHEHQTHHNPFPGVLPKIIGFEEKVEILQSLQKPKKVVIKGSDGKLYSIMCKPKDDLRKDCRLMELNSVINKFLLRDPQCRQRHLYIRTYAVVPLNEESGIVEWVENTSGLRNILYKIYKEKNLYTGGNEMKALAKQGNKDREYLRQVFEAKLLPKHPPVLGEWFTKLFSDPTAWYSSRQAFCRTTAVMSIVGYIVGLGDRHGENILLDSTNGDCVHVDLSCLFNKGETFDVPEIVPFRLTHNMINAMGVTGYEGTFRTCCEMTMKVLREQRDPLMCILKTLIHDPLVEWSSGTKIISSSSKAVFEPRNEMGVKIVNDIEQRLKGQTGKTLPLSVKGQVHSLIKEATDVYNLSQMYIGWGAYL